MITIATKNYEAIAKAKIRRPADNKRMPRLLVYGRNKKGKTRLCATAPDVLILDPEDGTAEEKKINPATWPVHEWEDVNEGYQYLKRSKHPYKWVALDGITKMHSMALRWVTKQEEQRDLDRPPNTVRIQDYGRANEMIKQMLTNFHTLRDVGIIITAQERMVPIEELDTIDDDEATVASYMFVPDISDRARSHLNAIVDLTGRLYIVTGDFTRRVRRDGEVIEEEYHKQRRLWVSPHDSYETGYRSQFELPDFLNNPTIPTIMKTMREGQQRASN